jgi:hypothetical protein
MDAGMIGRSVVPCDPPRGHGLPASQSRSPVPSPLSHVQGTAGEQGKAYGGLGESLSASRAHDATGSSASSAAIAALRQGAARRGSQVSEAGHRGLLSIRGGSDQELVRQGFRANFYFNRLGENLNKGHVIFRPQVSQTSAGLQHAEFFAGIGDPRHTNGSAQKNAEQEYLLQNMAKGPMYAASQIAVRHGLGIAVRGTGLTAHMGIEAGAPTKAQEFKNKTSKDIDLWLCDELQWGNIGAVVHFDPRVGWSSESAAKHALSHETPMLPDEPTEHDWQQKLEWIFKTRAPALMSMRSGLKMPGIEDLKEAFFSRAREYREEDTAYRHGEFQEHTTLAGPYIRLTVRPDENMVGDHDLFAFVEPDGTIASAGRVDAIQKELQESHEFQAQHGAIQYWEPNEDFHKQIRDKIVNAHSPQKGSPLVVLWPNGTVVAAYFNEKEGKLASPWDLTVGKQWLKQTWSGKKLLESQAQAAELPVDKSQPAQPAPQLSVG